MKREPVWRRYLRFWGPDPGSDLDDELQFHLEAKTEELIASGWPTERAHAEALRQFGPVRPIRRECYGISKGRQVEASRVEYLAGWLRDLRYAVRALFRAKASTAAAILILAVGIGCATGVFALIDRLLLRPSPVPKPSPLLLLSDSSLSGSSPGERVRHQSFPYSAYEQLRDRSRSIGLQLAGEAVVPVVERRAHDRIGRPAEATAVSGSYFETLGIRALWGRTLTLFDDEDRQAACVAMVSYRFWTQRYNRSPEALGATVYLHDVPFTIVGVLPRGFSGPYGGTDADLYIPIASLERVTDRSAISEGPWIRIFGRFQWGVAPETARARLHALSIAGLESREESVGPPGPWEERQNSLILVGAIAVLLLLMGCANVACLLMARSAIRQPEIAVSLALGAGRARVLRQSLMESFLLALGGGAVGMAVAFWAGRLLLIAFQGQRRPIDPSLGWRMVVFALAGSLAAGALFGLAPALRLLGCGREALSPARSVATRFASGKALVVVEIGLSLSLVAGANVFLRSFQNLRSVPTGFSTDHISVVTLGSTDGLLGHAPFRGSVALAESLRGAPRVEAAGISDLLTFNEGWIGYNIAVPGALNQAGRQVHLLKVDGAYFATLRIQLLAGRAFTALDDEHTPKVAILSEGTARRLFPGENPVGKRILLGGVPNTPADETEIVGIVNDIKFGTVTAPGPDLVLQPLLQGQHNDATTSTLELQVRSRMPPREVSALVRARIAELRLAVKVESAATLEDAVLASMQDHRIRMQASGLFGVLALLLITAGIWGLMAYLVVLRTRELGIRLAVGSRPGGLVRLVLQESLGLVLAGVMVGLPGALAVMTAVSHMVFGVAPFDWVSITVAALVLSVTAVLASVVPAWRAAHLDPLDVLRQQ